MPHEGKKERIGQKGTLARFLGLSTNQLVWFGEELRPFLKHHVAALVMATMSSVLLLFDAVVLRWLVDHGFREGSIKRCFVACGMLLLVFAFRTGLTSIGNYITGAAYQRFVMQLRLRLIKHLSSLPGSFHEHSPSGMTAYVIQESVHEVSVIGGEVIPGMLRLSILIVAVSIVMLYLNWKITAVLAPLIPLYLISSWRSRQKISAAYAEIDERQGLLSDALREGLTSVVQVQLLSKERWQARHLLRLMSPVYRAQVVRLRREATFELSNGMITAIGSVVVLLVGSIEVLRGALTVGGLVASYAYLLRLLDPLGRLADMQSKLLRTAVSIQRIHQLLTVEPLGVKVGLSAEQRGEEVIRLTNVSFNYKASSATIKNVTVSIREGERISIVGPSGAGKSTTAKLMVRLYEATAGQISIYGSDIACLPPGHLRKLIAYVPQRPSLFNMSIRDNLILGDATIDDNQVKTVSEIVGLAPIIARSSRGWNEIIGVDGMRLSGGERQRVAIARALLQRPKLLILDESTSQLDAISEALLYRTLAQAFSNMALLLISHRLDSLAWVDRLVVMRSGAVICEGPHQILMNTCNEYQRLVHAATASANMTPALAAER